MHAQTLDRDGDGSLFTHGRAWLFTNHSPNLEIEWVHGKPTCAATVNFDADERAITFHLALPFLFSYYLVIRSLPSWFFPRRLFAFARDGGRFSGERRTTGVRIFDWAIWFSLWEDATEWRSTDPWWMRVIIRPVDLLLGRQRYANTIVGEYDATLSLPEGDHSVHVKLERSTWTRPRWPWRPLTRTWIGAWVNVPAGVEVADHKRGGLHGAGVSGATSVEAALAGFRAKVMEQREQNGWRQKGST